MPCQNRVCTRDVWITERVYLVEHTNGITQPELRAGYLLAKRDEGGGQLQYQAADRSLPPRQCGEQLAFGIPPGPRARRRRYGHVLTLRRGPVLVDHALNDLGAFTPRRVGHLDFTSASEAVLGEELRQGRTALGDVVQRRHEFGFDHLAVPGGQFEV